MKRIAIVEDEDRAAEQLISYIARYEEESGQRFEVQRFSSADEFLSGYSPVYAAVFMDIQMPGTNGMDAAVRLRGKPIYFGRVFKLYAHYSWHDTLPPIP